MIVYWLQKAEAQTLFSINLCMSFDSDKNNKTLLIDL